MTVGIKMVRAKEARRRRPGFVAVCVIGVVLAEKARAGLPYFVSFGVIVAVGIAPEAGTAFAYKVQHSQPGGRASVTN